MKKSASSTQWKEWRRNQAVELRDQDRVYRDISTHDHLSVMSGITPAGQISTQLHNSALGAVESVHFVQHLHHCIGTKLLVIWDGSPIHRGRTVTSFLTAGAAQMVHLERLPVYAPELNPDEVVW